MASKQSNDEFKPDGGMDTATSATPRRKTAVDYFALAVSTCGVGYFPIAPGTMGSLVGVGLYVVIWVESFSWLEARAARGRLNLHYIFTLQMSFMLVIIFLLTMAGIWAASRAEKLVKKKDPSIVVIDEVAGQMIALLSGPFWAPTWWSVLSAFLLFRMFDIWKPYPIRRLEHLESGLGIMLDDVLAGAYALIVNSVLISAYLLLFPFAG